jgi:hypothetical protein
MARSIDFVAAKVHSDVCLYLCGLGAARRAWYGAQLVVGVVALIECDSPTTSSRGAREAGVSKDGPTR